jgi:hypothetical protein
VSDKDKLSERMKHQWENGTHPFIEQSYDWNGKKHKEETKRKIGEKASINQKGSGNSQYGTMWITDGCVNKKISKEEAVPEGWFKGRKLK